METFHQEWSGMSTDMEVRCHACSDFKDCGSEGLILFALCLGGVVVVVIIYLVWEPHLEVLRADS